MAFPVLWEFYSPRLGGCAETSGVSRNFVDVLWRVIQLPSEPVSPDPHRAELHKEFPEKRRSRGHAKDLGKAQGSEAQFIQEKKK